MCQCFEGLHSTTQIGKVCKESPENVRFKCTEMSYKPCKRLDILINTTWIFVLRTTCHKLKINKLIKLKSKKT